MTDLLPDIPFIVYLMLFAPVGVIVLVAAYKSRQARATRNWPSAPGIVVTSELEVRTIKVFDRNRETGFRFEERNFANIVYQYEVAGQTHSSSRVAIGADRGNSGVAETIARYPAGRRVSVYYNPDNPADAVLERGLPGLWRTIVWMAVVFVVLLFGAIIGFGQLARFAAHHIANAPLAIGLAAFGTMMLLAAFGMHRRAARARRWPAVTGTILTAGLERFRDARDGVHRGAKVFKAGVGYRYTYKGNDYVGSLASSGGEVMTTSARLAERATRRYRSGQMVDVHVNPDNPSESVLEPRARGIGVVLIAAIILFALAAFLALKG